MAESKRIVAVFGATGSQGGAVARALLEDGEFAVRGITRNADSDSAKALKDLGVEVVSANSDDSASLAQAMEKCYGVYFATPFEPPMNRETQRYKNAADAAKAAGVEHFVNSTLEDSRKLLDDSSSIPVLVEGENSRVPHFDGKAAAIEYVAAAVPTTHLFTSFYYENFINFGMGPQPSGEGNPLAITLPLGDAPMAMIALKDIGRIATILFKNSEKYIGTSAYISSEIATGEEIASKFARLLEQDVKWNPIPREVFASFGFPQAEDIANMFQLYVDRADHFSATRDPAKVREICPELTSLEQWLMENKDAIFKTVQPKS